MHDFSSSPKDWNAQGSSSFRVSSNNPMFLWSEVPWLFGNFSVPGLVTLFYCVSLAGKISFWLQFLKNLTATPGMWSPGTFGLWHNKTSEFRMNGPVDKSPFVMVLESGERTTL